MKKLIFVYNADSGFINSVSDYFSKKAYPEGYDCNLCKVTFPGWSMDKDWKEFIESLGIDSEFLHRDEFYKKFPNKPDFKEFPCVFITDGNKLILKISSEEINKCGTIPELKKLVKSKI